jgi:hypothetical protein
MREGVALVRDSRARSGLAKLARRGMAARRPIGKGLVSGWAVRRRLNYKTDGAHTEVLGMHA